MKKNSIAITGASGVLGKFFINKYKNYKFDIFKGDIKNYNEVKKWIDNTSANHILHFAAKVPTHYVKKNYDNSLKVNYVGTKNLVKSILSTKKFFWLFFASTSHVYKSSTKPLKETDPLKPISLYGKTKIKAENYLLRTLKEKSINICIGRIFSLTDKRQPMSYLVPALIKKIKSNEKKIEISNLNHDRDFIHIDDLCRAINLLKKKRVGGVFNIGSGIAINLFDILKLINNKNKQILYNKNKKKTSLIANISKIQKIGFIPRYKIKKIIKDIQTK